MEIILSTIESLSEILLEASLAYHTGTPLMSDEEYDAREAELRKLDSNHPTLAKVGAPTSKGWPKVRHPIPMGSLSKAQDDKSFESWLKDMPVGDLFISEKLDGMSLRLQYVDGLLVSAVTRGDGEEGEEITRNVSIMQGIPEEIPTKNVVHVRGEVICTISDFQEHFSGDSNPRNTATGTSKRQTNWRKAKHLTFLAYNLSIEGVEINSRYEEFHELERLGFDTPNGYRPAHSERLDYTIKLKNRYISEKRASLDYQIDGLVVEMNDTKIRQDLGESDLRPRGAIAFKFPSESGKTILRDVVWQVGGSGRVTPVAIFDPIPLAGAQVKQASLHNSGFINRLIQAAKANVLRVGDTILVSRRNEVIPFVEALLVSNASGDPILTQISCPACASILEMDGEYLVCKNSEECSAQILGTLRRWVSKTGALHMGEAILTALSDSGMVTRLGDLYRIDPQKVADLEMDGRKIGGNAARAIESLNENKNLTLDTVIGSIGIPMCGRKIVKLLVLAGYDTVEKLKNVSVSEMALVEGFGEIRARQFREGFDSRWDLIQDLLTVINLKTVSELDQVGTKMAGQAVCMTGFRDADMEKEILSQGGRIASGVNKKTTLLVAKDPGSSSGKAQVARELGLKILSPSDMWNLLRS